LLELAPHLQAVLEAGQTLVVPTAQRAAALRLAYATAQLAAGRRAFSTPEVHSVSGWLRAQPARSPLDGRPLRRLGASEEWLLWRDAVTAAAAHLSLPRVPGLVASVRQSAALLYEWRIPRELLQQHATPEAALLSESLTRIDARLDELSAAGAWHTLADLALAPPRRVPVFAGFASQTPARRALRDAWERRGTPSQEWTSAFAPGSAAVAHAVDPAQELATVAQWCRERLSAAPMARLLVIVPDLRGRHSEVRRVFDAALGADSGVYAVEGGQPLLDYAPVAAGARALQVLTSQVELAQLSQWLRDDLWPGIGPAPRAQLDVWLRTVVPPRLQIRQLLRALRAAPPRLLAHADAVAVAIERMLEALSEGAATLGEWSARFGQVFEQCELTPRAARRRNSHAQQVLQRLDELLQECAALPSVLGRFNAEAAVDVFQQLLARTRFEPATGDAAVTLTASLADPNLRYDGIWASGLHAGVIPQAARFDPFIPAALQRQAGMPAADAAAQVAQARQALETLHRCAAEFILSAPRQEGDLELTVSPLLLPFAAQSAALPAREGEEWPRAMRAARAMESYEDEPGVPWPPALPLPAGTRAIELQSRCPFRAYAQLRLGADPLETPVPGITPRERGSMLHRALELLWQRLEGSAGLAAARAESALERVIADCIAQAASEVLHHADADIAADATGLLELRRAAIGRERARAQRLIRTLCELEAGRAPFAIHELEGEHRLQVGGARIDVRIDRIDRLPDGTHAILDYKSGRAVTSAWEESRTTHPQLLVYLLAAGVPVSALAVAHLDPQSVVFKGIGDVDGRLPGVPGVDEEDSWERQRAAWREQVTQLAADFVRGEARVDPADGACDHCHLQAFCRIADTP
jgi:ATP-dependent helicase/nuclease subunit B